MSLTTDVIAALIDMVHRLQPEYTAQDRYTPVESLDDGDLESRPRVMVYNPTLNSAVLPYQQNEETHTLNVLFIRQRDDMGMAALAVRADTEVFRRNLDDDATLDGLTDNIRVQSWAHSEEQKRHVYGAVIVEYTKVTN